MEESQSKAIGKPEVVPIYTMDDAINVMQYFVPCPYGRQIEVADGITIKFTDIGHLLGSSSIEVWLREADVEKKLVFSGDIGNFNQPLIKDPSYTREADYVIMESTYGDRYHGKHQDYVTELTNVIQRTFDRGGNVVIHHLQLEEHRSCYIISVRSRRKIGSRIMEISKLL